MPEAATQFQSTALLELSRDAQQVNRFVNHPDVRPLIGAVEYGVVDMTPLVDVHENWFLLGEHGGFGALWRAPDVYEIHTFITRAGRGRWAVRAAFEAMTYASIHGAQMMFTLVPPMRPEVATFTAIMGFKPTDQHVPVLGVPHAVYNMGSI